MPSGPSAWLAVGLLFIAKKLGYQTDLMSYLFGNILLVPKESLWFMAALDGLLLVLAYHRQFLAVAFDQEFAHLRGIPVTFFYLLLLVMVAVGVIVFLEPKYREVQHQD